MDDVLYSCRNFSGFTGRRYDAMLSTISVGRFTKHGAIVMLYLQVVELGFSTKLFLDRKLSLWDRTGPLEMALRISDHSLGSATRTQQLL